MKYLFSHHEETFRLKRHGGRDRERERGEREGEGEHQEESETHTQSRTGEGARENIFIILPTIVEHCLHHSEYFFSPSEKKDGARRNTLSHIAFTRIREDELFRKEASALSSARSSISVTRRVEFLFDRRRTPKIVDTIPTTTTIGMTVPRIMNRVLLDEGPFGLRSILIVVDRVVEEKPLVWAKTKRIKRCFG